MFINQSRNHIKILSLIEFLGIRVLINYTQVFIPYDQISISLLKLFWFGNQIFSKIIFRIGTVDFQTYLQSAWIKAYFTSAQHSYDFLVFLEGGVGKYLGWKAHK